MLKKSLAFILTVLLLSVGMLPAASATQTQNAQYEPLYQSSEALNGKTVAVPTGSVQENIVREIFPDSEIVYFNGFADCLLAVKTGKADFAVVPSDYKKTVFDEYPELTDLEEQLKPSAGYFGFAKTAFADEVRALFNAFLTEKWDSGEMDKFLEERKSDFSTAKTVDFSALTGTKGEIKFAMVAVSEPNFHPVDGGYSGIEAELLYEFCEKNGYTLTPTITEITALLAGLGTGKFDIGGYLGYTAERAETVNFSEPYFKAYQMMVVKKVEVSKKEQTNGGYKTSADLTGKTVATIAGSVQEKYVKDNIPDCQFVYVDNFTDGLLAVKAGKADFTLLPNENKNAVEKEYPELTALAEEFSPSSIYFGFSKTPFGDEVLPLLNAFIKAKRESGEIDRLMQERQSDPSSAKVVDFSALTGTKGEIRFSMFVTVYPHFSIANGGYSGLEAELLYEFCEQEGYTLAASVAEFSSILAGLASGKIDVSGEIAYTEERTETINFSEPYLDVYQMLIVRKADAAGIGTDTVTEDTQKESFFASLKTGFEKNFIRQARWKMLLRGLGVTVEIALLSALFGTLLGCLFCAVRRSKIKWLAGIMAGIIRLVQGIPIVVTLLVLYYIIFADAAVSGLAVGVFAFSLDFGVYVAEILRSGLMAIDNGQWEAAAALGLSRKQSYTKVIIPQMLIRSLPVYKGQFISMLKMTSVVGYVTVQDLTKASDIIRSQTFDAFMPIFVTAAIYFLLAWLLTRLLGLIEIKISPEHRKKVLRDVDTTVKISENAQAVSRESGNDTLIELKHLRKVYESGICPLQDVSVKINRGDIISVIGPSGTGKSTLLRCINRLEEISGGEVEVFGKTVTKGKSLYEMRRQVGMVFQSFNLFSHLTVIENIMLAPVTVKGENRQKAYENGMRLLASVGLREWAFSYPHQLSGGQKQRVAIVRALAMEPEALLLDEPTSALDPTMVGEVLHVITRLAQSGLTMLIVTHEMKFARDVSNRCFYMDMGGIYEDGSCEQIFEHPQKDLTRIFIQKIKRFTTRIQSKEFDFVALRNHLEQFGYSQLMEKDLFYKMILSTEELTVQGLTHLSEDCFPASFSAEYTPDGKLTLFISYGGVNKDMTDGMDVISQKLLSANVLSMMHTFDAETGNELRVVVG